MKALALSIVALFTVGANLALAQSNGTGTVPGPQKKAPKASGKPNTPEAKAERAIIVFKSARARCKQANPETDLNLDNCKCEPLPKFGAGRNWLLQKTIGHEYEQPISNRPQAMGVLSLLENCGWKGGGHDWNGGGQEVGIHESQRNGKPSNTETTRDR